MLTAFFTGLVGSLHCLGMCGPIALALPGTEKQGWRYLLGRLLYNLGRLLTYSLLGGLVALLGVAASMFELQRWFSLALGVILILIALRHYGIFGKRAQTGDNLLSRAWRQGMSKVMQLRGFWGLFALGLMNGILPCGLVYAGLFLAANSTYAWEGMAKMALFGLGTMPLMLSLSWSGKWLTSWLRNKSRFVMPAVMTFMGILFVLRGMALGIPYLSPKMEAGSEPGKVKMSCCEKIEGGRASNPAKSSTDCTAPKTPTGKTP